MTFLQEIEQNAQEIRRLLNVPTHPDISLTITAFSEALDIVFAAITEPPIGTILPWHKNAFPVTPSLPPQWVECNGQTVADPESPFNGQTLPNLNDGDFLRGNTTSGGTGGAATHTHPFSATTGPENISVSVSQATADVNCAGEGHTHAVSGTTDNSSSLPPYFEAVWIIRIK